MKGKTLITSITLILVLSLSLIPAIAVADGDDANTVTSSTMWFKGTLTSDGSGGYNGILPMIDEAATGKGDNESGFDVYARNGVKATYDKAGSGTQDYACGVISLHDAYNTAGGWGSFYDPDVADWDNYQLRLQDGNWYLEYNANVGNDGDTSGATAPPMSGTVDWTAGTDGYAIETGAGAYYSASGAESSGYALNNPCTGTNDGTAAWDMDWSWGSEYIPLQYPGFDITLENVSGSTYRVIMKPDTAGSTKLTVNVPDIVAISVDPTSIDYGSLVPGQTSAEKRIDVQNVGTHTVDVDVDLTTGSADLFKNNLKMRHDDSGSWTTKPWDDIITGLTMGTSDYVKTKLPVPAGYTPNGTETAKLVFTATAV